MLDEIVSSAPVFLLVAVRCFATIMTLPLFSSRAAPRMAKIALAGCMAYMIFPQISIRTGFFSDYGKFVSPTGNFNLDYVFLLAGEAMIGIILGFFIQLIFAAFSTAGQFFAFQMGLTASEVYDSLSQVENPLMGQFFNFMAMLVFFQSGALHRFFFDGIYRSFASLNVFSILNNQEYFSSFMMKSLSVLFKDALVIAMPIMASLFLINVTVGILSKAAPQMNLLSEGFPILMLVSYFLILSLIPNFMRYFSGCFKSGFKILGEIFAKVGEGAL